MKRFTGLIISCGLLACLGLACERMDMSAEDRTAIISTLTTIPVEYGELEAVTELEEYPGWFQLCFEDEAGTIRFVRVQVLEGLILNEVKTIERSGSVAKEVTEDER